MKSITEIVVIWNNRKQNLKESTEEIIIFLERLKLFDPNFSKWFKQANSRAKALEEEIILDFDYIKKALCSKCKDGDYDEFSFLVGFWNGGKTEAQSYGIRFSIGGESKVGTNNCILTFPTEGELYRKYSDTENWNKLLSLFIDHWNPDKYRDFNDNLIEL